MQTNKKKKFEYGFQTMTIFFLSMTWYNVSKSWLHFAIFFFFKWPVFYINSTPESEIYDPRARIGSEGFHEHQEQYWASAQTRNNISMPSLQ